MGLGRRQIPTTYSTSQSQFAAREVPETEFLLGQGGMLQSALGDLSRRRRGRSAQTLVHRRGFIRTGST